MAIGARYGSGRVRIGRKLDEFDVIQSRVGWRVSGEGVVRKKGGRVGMGDGKLWDKRK